MSRGIFKQHHAFDAEGIFIGDGTYLFVPDNDTYEGSVRLLFDEHNHPVDSSKLTKKEQGRLRPAYYSLLQWYLLRTERKQLNPKTQSRILDLLRPVFSVIVIYYQNYVAFLDPLEYQEMVLTLSEPARQKILAITPKACTPLENY